MALFGAIKADLLAIEIEEDRASKKERKPTLFESKLNDEKWLLLTAPLFINNCSWIDSVNEASMLMFMPFSVRSCCVCNRAIFVSEYTRYCCREGVKHCTLRWSRRDGQTISFCFYIFIRLKVNYCLNQRTVFFLVKNTHEF